MLSCLAIVIGIMESLIPRPLPWFKLGLANIINLIVLIIWGFRVAFIVLVVRVTGVGLILGTLMTPAFVLAFSGGLLSIIVMNLAKFIRCSVIGISVTGGLFHNIGQWIILFILMRHSSLIAFLPLLLITGIFSGLLTGLIIWWIENKYKLGRILVSNSSLPDEWERIFGIRNLLYKENFK